MPWPRFFRSVFDLFCTPANEEKSSFPIRLRTKDQDFVPTLFSIYREDLNDGYFFKDFPRVCRRIYLCLPTSSTSSSSTEGKFIDTSKWPMGEWTYEDELYHYKELGMEFMIELLEKGEENEVTKSQTEQMDEISHEAEISGISFPGAAVNSDIYVIKFLLLYLLDALDKSRIPDWEDKVCEIHTLVQKHKKSINLKIILPDLIEIFEKSIIQEDGGKQESISTDIINVQSNTMKILKIMTQAMVLTAVGEITDFCMKNSPSTGDGHLDPSYSFLWKDVRGIEGWNYTIDLRPENIHSQMQGEGSSTFIPNNNNSNDNNIRLIMQQQRQSIVMEENPNYYFYTYQIICTYTTISTKNKANKNNREVQSTNQVISLKDVKLQIVHLFKHPNMPSHMQEFVNRIIPLENEKELLIASSESPPTNPRK